MGDEMREIQDQLATTIDRLRQFQKGKHACVENQWALDHLMQARSALIARQDTSETENNEWQERAAMGVEYEQGR
jgi:hypothetical protein